MKLSYFVALCGLWVLNSCGDDNAKVYLEEKKYAIEDEISYSAVLYDSQNSLILSLLGMESNNPDQARQIDEIREQNHYVVEDAELRAAIQLGRVL